MWTRRRPPPRDRRLGCGHVKGFRLGGLTAEEAVALERPAMTYVCEQLRQRLSQQVRQAWWRWLHPTSGHGVRHVRFRNSPHTGRGVRLGGRLVAAVRTTT
jgi:hypothetical protein